MTKVQGLCRSPTAEVRLLHRSDLGDSFPVPSYFQLFALLDDCKALLCVVSKFADGDGLHSLLPSLLPYQHSCPIPVMQTASTIGNSDT